jgi:hypothetical protein
MKGHSHAISAPGVKSRHGKKNGFCMGRDSGFPLARPMLPRMIY